jgi:hypothetical protein
MAQTIKIKNSSVAAKVPVTGDLAYGEIALNYADGKIYYKKSDNTIQSISSDLSSPGPIGGITPGAGTFTTLIGGAGSANIGQLTGSATTKAVQFQTLGSDTNISMAFQPKGTGAIDLAAGSSGVNISNGSTVTAITRTAGGLAYTSIPSVVISAPTTSGGTQAVATGTVNIYGAALVSGGSGYTVGDVLTAVGGTGTAVVIVVATLSGTAVATVTYNNYGNYSVIPTNPVSFTGGTGTGCTFNYSYSVNILSITTAGSGYVEQPTVTFSGGGGGSGAAAYATVGGTAKITGIGAQTDFYTPSGAILSTLDGGLPATGAYLQLTNSSSSNSINRVIGSGTNLGLYWLTKGTSSHAFATNNNTATVQFQVAHTASAVNYVQVTGSATGYNPVISVQGSDATRSLQIASKGTTFVYLQNNGNVSHFSAGGTSLAVNFLNARGNASGTGPALEAVGTDTNIDLALTPKGTGAVLINSILGLNAVTASTTATTADQVLATFDATLYRTVKFVIQANSNATNYSSTEILAIHNGTTASYTEYATVTIGTACAVYSVDYSSATIRLLATPASATATTYKIAAQLTRI